MTLVAGHTAGVKWKSVPVLLVQWVRPMCSPYPALGHAGRHTVCPQSSPLVSVTSVLEVAAKTLRIYKGGAQTTEGV